MDGIQRLRLLAAVADVAVERGVGDITVSDVVARAGVSRRTFYELFDNGEDCLLAAVDDVSVRISHYVLAHYDRDAAWIERIRTGLACVLAFIDSEPDASRLLLVGSLGAIPGTQERHKRMVDRLVAVIDEGRMLTQDGSRLPPLTAEGIVGGMLSVMHARLAKRCSPAIELLGPLMSMIVLPYLGAETAQCELERVAPKSLPTPRLEGNPLSGLSMRMTYRTVRVLAAVAANPGASNRAVSRVAEVMDQGQMSKLLARLHNLGLIENGGPRVARGEPNAWSLTEKGRNVHEALADRATQPSAV